VKSVAAAAAGLGLVALAQAGNLAPTAGAYGATLGAGAATAAERSGFGQNPAALRPDAFGLRLDCHRPYGMDDLGVAEAGASLDGKRAGLACDWRVTSITDLYSEQGFRLAPSVRILARDAFPGTLDLGYGISAWRSALAGSAPAWDPSQEAGVAWRPWPRLKAGAFAAGLPLHPAATLPGRFMQIGLEADSRDPEAIGKYGALAQVLRLDFRKSGDGAWKALASLSVRPYGGVEASVGVAARPFQIAAGMALAWQGFRIRQALRYHRYLGRTWLSGLDYERATGPGT
jgi:hypothetical protein